MPLYNPPASGGVEDLGDLGITASAAEINVLDDAPPIRKLGSATINLNSTGTTTVFTCPTGKKCVVTEIIGRSFSGAVNAPTLSMGWNGGNGVVEEFVMDFFSGAGATKAVRFGAYVSDIGGAPLKAVEAIGNAGETFGVTVSVAGGSALTCVFDVFGYTYDA